MSPQAITVDPSEVQSIQVDPSEVSAVSGQTTTPGLWDKIKQALSSHAELDEGRANYYKRGGDLPAPGSTEGPGMIRGLAEYDKASGGEIGGGVHDILQGNVAKGLHRIIGGVGAGVSPMAVMAAPAAIAAAPVSTALSVGGGIAGQQLAQKGAQALGATPDQSNLAGDVGGMVGGYAGSKLAPLVKRAVLLGKTPEGAYESALKPSTTMSQADRAGIVQTGLSEKIPVSKSGMEMLGDKIDDLNTAIKEQIDTGTRQGVTVSPKAVAARTAGTEAAFANQVNPNADLQAIQGAKQEFLANNPNPIPAAQAQSMKQGTYRVLGNKAYGEQSTASVEAQKALARGLKEELASQFPEIQGLNTAESKLLDLKPVLERAVGRISNHQLMGIGTPVAAGAAKAVTGSNKLAAITGVLKAVLDDPAVKSRLAIAMSQGGGSLASAHAKIAAYQTALGAFAGRASTSDIQDQGASEQP